MISFDTDILVYATVSVADAKARRARDLITRAMRGMMDHLIAASPCGVRERGDPQGGNTDRGHPKDDRCFACTNRPRAALSNNDYLLLSCPDGSQSRPSQAPPTSATPSPRARTACVQPRRLHRGGHADRRLHDEADGRSRP